jgi:hypothetical protein
VKTCLVSDRRDGGYRDVAIVCTVSQSEKWIVIDLRDSGDGFLAMVGCPRFGIRLPCFRNDAMQLRTVLSGVPGTIAMAVTDIPIRS